MLLEKQMIDLFDTPGAKYFGEGVRLSRIRKIKEIVRKNSKGIVFEGRLCGGSRGETKKILIKEDRRVDYDFYGGVANYCLHYEKIRRFLERNTSFRLPQIYDFIVSPPMIIREYIEGRDYKTQLYGFPYFLNPVANRKLLDAMAELICTLPLFDLGELDFQNEKPLSLDLMSRPILRPPQYGLSRGKTKIRGLHLFEDSLKKDLLDYFDEVENSGIGTEGAPVLVINDLHTGNIIFDRKENFYLIDFDFFAGPLLWDAVFFVGKLVNQGFRYSAADFSNAPASYVRFFLESLLKRQPSRFSFKKFQFFLLRDTLKNAARCFRNRRAFWPLLKGLFERDIKDLMAGRYMGLNLKDFFS